MDANIVLRILIGDDLLVLKKWEMALLDAPESTFLIEPVTIAEVVWAASSFYKASIQDTVKALTTFLQIPSLACQRDVLISALAAMITYNIDFADAYLAMLSLSGEKSVYSLDKDFQKIPGLTHLKVP